MASTDPASIDISKSSGVTISWRDGHHSEYELQYLREQCPCAMCGKVESKPAPPAALQPTTHVQTSGPHPGGGAGRALCYALLLG